jgi:CubicO group peptidase (beta-lactamase class C family)
MLGETPRVDLVGGAAVDLLELLTRAPLPFLARSPVPHDVESVVDRGQEEAPAALRGAIERVWDSALALYRTGVHPALQLCIRYEGQVVLDRAVGYASGNAPDDPPELPKVRVTTATPFCLYSASKAVTAMVIHKLDERRRLHVDDRVCDYVPEFGRHHKQWITIRHLLAHRAGIPNVPPEAMRLELLAQPERINEILCDARPASRPGRLLSYHAVSGGFVLAEVVRRATGEDIGRALEREIAEPLGFRWMRYGVADEDVPRVAVDAVTGPPPPPPLAQLLRRALGMGVDEVVRMARDPRFLTGIVPSANVVSNAGELASFFDCLLHEGALGGRRIFDPRTVRHALSEQSYREVDLTLFVPLRYGLGLMLGDDPVGIFGQRTPRAFGHLGYTNIWGWADPERRIAVALLTSGKPVLSLHAVRVLQLLWVLNGAFPRVARGV